MEFIDKRILFNDSYAYHSSGSLTMLDHFRSIANSIKNRFRPNRVLEIGSNDGVFLRHFGADTAIGVEPCGNFARITRDLGYTTHEQFWSDACANMILANGGPVDVVYAANCMCHIPNIVTAFEAVERVLTDDGVFIFEDPSLGQMLDRNSYDQIYDEHAHIFSVTSLQRLLSMSGLELWRVDGLNVHGGSNRIYAKKKDSAQVIALSVRRTITYESEQGLDGAFAFLKFANKVKQSKIDLVNMLWQLKKEGKKVIGYGATSKSTVVYNYCGIGPDLIEYVIDSTPSKQGLFTPGTHIPIVSEDRMDDSVDCVFLGAWNYVDEIMKKESAFCERGGRFITHVPTVRMI